MRMKMSSKYENTHLGARAPWRAMMIEIAKALGFYLDMYIMLEKVNYHLLMYNKKGINVLV